MGVEYLTKTGDEWDVISRNIYGSEKYVGELLKANPAQVGTIIFESGVKLKIPEIEKEKAEYLKPKWER